MEQSAIKVDELTAEMTKLKTKSQPPSNRYASKVGAATAGRRTFDNTPKQSLGIRIKGVPEAPDDTTDWLHDDKKNVLDIMDELAVEAKLTKLSRLGQKDPKKGPCIIIINIYNQLEKEVMVKSAHKLKGYSRISNPVFISHELSKEYMKKENEALILRRKMIAYGFNAKHRPIRNLKIQKLLDKTWTIVSTVEEGW